MTYIYGFILAVAAVCFGTADAFAQTSRAETDHALRVLKGVDTDETPQWALETLEDAAHSGSAYAMKKLGLVYADGTGVSCDTAKAVAWLEKAAEHGSAKECHDIGLMFKYARGCVRQDFGRAYRLFCMGAGRRSAQCIYAKGFMLYKGLGCRQDYREAWKCFKAAASRGHSPSVYMLGLCYRNGYGVEKNAKKAYRYLERAAAAGYRDAREELGRSNEETYLHEALAGNPDYAYVPDSVAYVPAALNDTAMMAGDYHGYVVMADWSGRFLLGEKPLAMRVDKRGNEVGGFMVIGVDTVSFRAELTADNRLVFRDGSVMLRERYAHEYKVKYCVDNMAFGVWGDRVSGRLNLYSLKQREPERPMYFELVRDGQDGGVAGGSHGGIAVAPNPFSAGLTAGFELQCDADVQVWMFNAYGMMEWQTDLGHLEKGRHEIVLSPDVRAGRYIMNIKAGRQNLHEIVVCRP